MRSGTLPRPVAQYMESPSEQRSIITHLAVPGLDIRSRGRSTGPQQCRSALLSEAPARIIPAGLTKLLAYGFQLLPDKKQWWDAEKKENCNGSHYNYPWYSTHSLGQILQLGFKVQAFGRRKPPAAAKIWVVINDHDGSVNNTLIMRLVKTWQKSNASQLQIFHFPVELGLPHDCISIEQPKANTRLVYAELMRMLG